MLTALFYKATMLRFVLCFIKVVALTSLPHVLKEEVTGHERRKEDVQHPSVQKRGGQDYERFVRFCNSSFFGYHDDEKLLEKPVLRRFNVGRHQRYAKEATDMSGAAYSEANFITVETWWPKESTLQLLITRDPFPGSDAAEQCIKKGGKVASFEKVGVIDLLFGESVDCDTQSFNVGDQFWIGLYGSKNDIAVYMEDDPYGKLLLSEAVWQSSVVPPVFGFFWEDGAPLLYDRWWQEDSWNSSSRLVPQPAVVEAIFYFENATGATGVLCGSMDMLTAFHPRLCEDRLRVLCMRDKTVMDHPGTNSAVTVAHPHVNPRKGDGSGIGSGSRSNHGSNPDSNPDSDSSAFTSSSQRLRLSFFLGPFSEASAFFTNVILLIIMQMVELPGHFRIG